MKFQSILWMMLLGMVISLSVSSCGEAPKAADTNQTEEAINDEEGSAEAAVEAVPDESGPEYTSAYICPMHCKGSGSAEPGTCPVCGMDLVMNENAKKADDGHDHDHDHGDHDGHNH
jgi:hypothetical protein